ncbi:hypothetical protein BY458DRAFT_586342 [Sporodiniella umbellata]|nr:hypothetical protein BY458DRAFT_586342 [Sporodiniella umbellata]
MPLHRQESNAKTKQKAFPFRSSNGKFDINYETFELNIPNYLFAKPTELDGAGSLIAISLGKRLTDNKLVLAKISPHLIRLEREYYLSKRLHPICPNYIPHAVEYISLSQKGLAALLYTDLKSSDFLYFKHNYQSLFSNSALSDKTLAWPCKPFTLDIFLKFAIECCSALQFLHENGVIHGELRPSAFYCDYNQDLEKIETKIWNFGGGLKSYEDLLLNRWKSLMTKDIISQQDMPQHYQGLYSSKELQSSLIYVSPEQTGRTSNVIDHRTDLYSLGIIFFVLLTNRAPFEGTPMDIIEAILSKNVPLVHTYRKDIPPVISSVIDKLTRKSVDERYDSAYGLREDLLECQRRLEAHSQETLVFFPLGQRDVNPVFKIASGVYGRETELDLVHSIVERVSALNQKSQNEKQHSQSKVIVLKGPGGIGKSTLATMIHTEARHFGYTATAKFDKNQKSPYNGLLRCLSSILKQLLTEPEYVVKEFYTELKDKLGPQFTNVRLLVNKVPELRPILYNYKERSNSIDEDALSSILNTETRFHSVFLSIMRVIARKKMITLCLDDLQEADEPSIKLIQALIFARSTMLIIVTHRDEKETPPNVIRMLENVSDRIIATIQLRSLPIEIIQELVRHTFYSTYHIEQIETIQPLVDLIYTWTRGNPFYAKQFLRTMRRKGDIWFDWNDKNWKFRLDHKRHQHVFDARQLVLHLKSLDAVAQNLLMWASLMGHTFDFDKIKRLMKEDAVAGLQTVLNEGVIQYKAGNEFNFVHDRYYQAASMLIISQNQRDAMHFKIGKAFMTELDEEEDGRVYWVADNLLKGLQLIRSCSHTKPFRDVLLRAGNEATLAGALQIAASYYESVLLLLPQERWVDGADTSFDETLHLYIKLLELGNNTKISDSKQHEMIQEVFEHTQDYPLERVQVWRLQARNCFQNTDYAQGLKILLDGLEEMGVSVDYDVADLYQRVKTNILAVGFEALNELGPCKDVKKLAIMILLNEACTGAHWLDPHLADVLGLKICEISLESGYTSSSGGGLIWAGCTATRFMEYTFAADVGAFGMSIAEKYAGFSEIARAIIVHHSMLAPWAGVPTCNYFEQFQKAYTYAIAGGDGLFSSLALFHASTTLYWTSRHLADIKWNIEKALQESKRNSAKDVFILNTLLSRSVSVLQGKADPILNPETLMSESENFDEILYVKSMKNQSSGNALSWYYSCKIILLFHFGFCKEAAESGFKIFDGSTNDTVHRHIGMSIYYHSHSLIECLRDPSLEPEEYKKYRTQLDIHKENLNIMASHSSTNYGLSYKMLCAQLSTLEGDLGNTLKLFNIAIKQCEAEDRISSLGFAYELIAQHYIRSDLDTLVPPMLEKAIEYYQQWGAYGKAQYLCKTYGQYLEKAKSNFQSCAVQTEDVIVGLTTNVADNDVWENASDGNATDSSVREISSSNEGSSSVTAESPEKPETTLFSLDMVDLTSIIKSSQVMSNEMNSFDELLKKMMGIIMANVGAESGAIVIKEGQFGIAAYSTRLECETHDPPLPLDSDKLLTSIIHYVIHTHSVLFIPNVEEDARFATGVNRCSVICMPILHKNTLVGVLYLQANISTFTYKHVNVLNLLCDQIGISITNALLFKSLQKATKTNAQMIKSQLKALEEARESREQALRATKMKSNFLANMSHELRTPFSGFYGMISLLSETRLDAEQREFVFIAKQSCEMLLHIIDDLLDFSKLEAHKVKLHYGLCYIEDIIADRLELLITLATNKNVGLSYFIDKDVPPIIYADGNRIGQILLNLIGNAIKFTHHGEVTIHCSVEKQLNDTDIVLKASVQDTGIGMSEDEIKGLFLPFSQVDGSTTRNFGGTGLGLSICLQLVKLMQGEITVLSHVNQGSTFFFTFCVKTGAAVNAEPTEDSRSKAVQDLSEQLGQPRILVVSSVGMKNMLEASLSMLSLDYEQSMENAIESIVKKAKNEIAYDCIIVDDPLPDVLKQLIMAIESEHRLQQTRVLILIAPTIDNIRRANISPKLPTDLLQYHFLSHPLVTRMSKPIRKLKLLNSLITALSVLESPVPSPSLDPELKEPKPMPTFSSARKTQEGFSPEELAVFKGQKILVAEDNVIAQKLIVKQLSKLGFIVEKCNNGIECFDTWKEKGPGYFLLAWIDHHMPKCDGIEATKEIRAYEKKMNYESQLPIVALTADIQVTAQKNCIQAGMNDYVTKPLMQKDLANILRKYCFASGI